jgi:hypothetical protein
MRLSPLAIRGFVAVRVAADQLVRIARPAHQSALAVAEYDHPIWIIPCRRIERRISYGYASQHGKHLFHHVAGAVPELDAESELIPTVFERTGGRFAASTPIREIRREKE